MKKKPRMVWLPDGENVREIHAFTRFDTQT